MFSKPLAACRLTMCFCVFQIAKHIDFCLCIFMQNMQGFYTVYTVRTFAIVLEIIGPNNNYSLDRALAGIWNMPHLGASPRTPPTRWTVAG